MISALVLASVWVDLMGESLILGCHFFRNIDGRGWREWENVVGRRLSEVMKFPTPNGVPGKIGIYYGYSNSLVARWHVRVVAWLWVVTGLRWESEFDCIDTMFLLGRKWHIDGLIRRPSLSVSRNLMKGLGIVAINMIHSRNRFCHKLF